MSARILLVIKGLGRGGAEQLLVNAARYVDRSRFEYEVSYLLPHKDDLAGELERLGMPVHCFGGAGPRWIPRLRVLVRERDIDLVHSHLPYAGIGARLGLRGRVPLVYTEHNVWDMYRPTTRVGNMLTLRAEDHVFAVSRQVLDSMRPPRWLSPAVRLPDVEVLHHGIDPEAVAGWRRPDGVRRELGISPEAFVVGTVANFRPEKAHHDLIRAARDARMSIPGVRFVLVGRGPTEPEIRQLVRRWGLEETVTFAGYRTDAPRICSAFDVFALASVHEGLSIALLEAMALGKPAVVTSAGGLPEVVRDGVDGFVVPPGNPRALADGIARLAHDSSMRTRFASKARERALRFDIRGAVDRMEAVYASLLRLGASHDEAVNP